MISRFYLDLLFLTLTIKLNLIELNISKGSPRACLSGYAHTACMHYLSPTQGSLQYIISLSIIFSLYILQSTVYTIAYSITCFIANSSHFSFTCYTAFAQFLSLC